MLKGVLHVHSTYSDGEFTLAELRDLFLADGCRFACITDHASAFDPAKLDAFCRECEERSDDRFLFIAGLEFDCHRGMHMLGYGVTALTASADAEIVIDHIVRHGGIAVVAHPKETAFWAIESFDRLPSGIETWNTKYDGRFAPRASTFAFLSRLRQLGRPAMRAFYGQDLHWRKQYRKLFTMVQTTTLERSAILVALQRGDYVGVKGRMQLPSTGELPAWLLARFARVQPRSRRIRQWLRRGKHVADSVGFVMPKLLKSQLRRIF